VSVAKSGRGRNVAIAAQRVLAEVAGGRLLPLPVALRFWDGSMLSADGQLSGAPAVSVRSPLALSYLLRSPNQIGLARAWVTGLLDVDGSHLVELARSGSRRAASARDPGDRGVREAPAFAG
jgi:hypothetical protein